VGRALRGGSRHAAAHDLDAEKFSFPFRQRFHPADHGFSLWIWVKSIYYDPMDSKICFRIQGDSFLQDDLQKSGLSRC